MGGPEMTGVSVQEKGGRDGSGEMLCGGYFRILEV